MGAMQGGSQSSAQRQGATPRKGAGRRSSSSSSSSSSVSTMKPERAVRRKPENLKVQVVNLVDGPPSLSTGSPIEKRMVEKPRWDSSVFLQPDQFMSELKVKTSTPRSSSPAVSDSPKSARSVRSFRASFDTPRNEALWEPTSPLMRKPFKPLEWTGKETGAPKRDPWRSQSTVASQLSQPETFYDSLATLESPESLESPRSPEPLPKLELSYEGKPAPAPAHLRARVGSPLPMPSEKPSLDFPALFKSSSEGSGRSKGAASPALLKLQATSTLLANGSNSRSKIRSTSSRKESSGAHGEGDTKTEQWLQGTPTRLTSNSAPLKPDVEAVEADVKPAGLLRRMMHWGASKLGKKSSSKVSSRSKNGGSKDITSQPTDSKSEAQMATEVDFQVVVKDEKEVTEGEVENLDSVDSPRSSVSSVGTTFSDASSKAHNQKHKKHVKSEIVKSKLWLLRVHQKLQGRVMIEGESEAFPAGARGATFHGYPVDASFTEPVDKKMLTASARFNSESVGVSKSVGMHRRNSTWDAGKLSNATEYLFSPNQKLPKRDTQGLLTPPRRLTGDTTTDFQRRRRPASITITESLAPPDKSSSPRKPRAVNSRVAPDHHVTDTGTKSRVASHRYGELSQAAAPLQVTASSPSGTFLQTAALILATPGSKDEPDNQLFENSRKGAPPRSESSNTTTPISPTGVSQQTSFKGFNLPAPPLPVRVSTHDGSPTSPMYSSTRYAKSPVRSPRAEGVARTPTTPTLLALSPGCSGMQNPASSPGIFAPSPGWVEMQRSPRSSGARSPTGYPRSPRAESPTGYESLGATSQGLNHARSHGSIAGEHILVEDISFTSLVKRPEFMEAQSVQTRSDAATPAAGPRNGVIRPRSTVSDDRERSEKPKSDSSVSGLPFAAAAASSPRPLPLLGGISFEQIVAGRGRSPPTDNTLMKFFFNCREIEHLNKFLALQKKRFLETFNSPDSNWCFHMILSESGQGLSSMISTLCTAWLLQNTMASASVKWHPVPVMNISQKEMWQHRDAAWLFHVCGIEPSALLFIDEVSITPETLGAGRVKRAITGQDILQTKDEVASSCTIVSEKFRQEAPKLLQARYMKTLLLAGILVDSMNLSSGSSRDKQQAAVLLVGAGSLGRNGFYNHLVNIRDENYVTTFIKEIYGDSRALTEQSASRGPGGELSKPTSRPTSIIVAEEPPKPTTATTPTKASRKSAPELKLRTKSAPETKSPAPLNKRGWFRSRPTAQ